MKSSLPLLFGFAVVACGSSVRHDDGRGTGGSFGRGSSSVGGATSVGGSGGNTTATGGSSGDATAAGGSSGDATATGGSVNAAGTGMTNMAGSTGAGATGGRPPVGGATGMGGKPPVSVECEPDPALAGAPADTVTPSGCTITGTALLSGRTDHAGTRVTIVDARLSTTTAADGSYSLAGVPPGVAYPLEFRNGDYRATLPNVICGDAAIVNDIPLADNPLELYAGIRLDEQTPLYLSQPPSERVIHNSSTSTWVVDRSCGPAKALGGASTDFSDDGRVVACFGQAYLVPDDPAFTVSLVKTSNEVVVSRGGHYVAYASGNDVHILDVTTRADRKVGVGSNLGAELEFASDEAHLVFTGQDGNYDIAATAGSDPAMAVSTFAPQSGLPGQALRVLSPDGRYLAFDEPDCQVNCGLFLAGMDGTSKILGTVVLPMSAVFGPDSKNLLFESPSGYVSVSLETGEQGTFTVAPPYPVSFALGGSLVIYPTRDNQLAVADASGGDAIVTVNGINVLATSPDGRWVFMNEGSSADNATMNVAVLDVETRTVTPLEPELGWQFGVLFAPDSSRAAFSSGASDRVMKSVELTPSLPVITLGPGGDPDDLAGFSPDGRYVFYTHGATLSISDGAVSGVVVTDHYDVSHGEAVDWLGSTGVVAGVFYAAPYDFLTGSYLLFVPHFVTR